MHPIAFQLGRLPIHWYGVMVALGFMAGLWTASRRGLREGVAAEKILDLGPWLILGAIVGARTLYVISYWREEFAAQPMQVFMIQKGGLVFYGGLIGSSLACVIYVRLKKLPLWKLADILAPSVALGYVFGRIGCLMNGCCYGRICDVPWAIQYPNQSPIWRQHYDLGLVGATDRSAPVHPTQIYESLLNLGFYVGLAWLYRRKKFDGQVFGAYLVGYALLRSLVEMFRGDYPQHYLGGWATPAHLLSIGILAAGAVLLFVQSRTAPQRG